jgi:DNA polymerase III subunit delta
MGDVEELLAQIATGKFAPVYVLSSDHPILVDRIVAALRDAVVTPALRAFNYDVVEGKLTASRIVNMAQTLPMMSPKRMVYVRDLAGLPTDETDAMLEYFASPNPSTVLLAVTSKLDKRLKLYSTLSKKGWLHVLTAPRQLAPWVRAEAAARNVRIDGAAITRMLDAIGGDLSRIAVTLDQLALFAGDRPITSDDVDELVADTRERSVFELTDALGTGSLPGALNNAKVQLASSQCWRVLSGKWQAYIKLGPKASRNPSCRPVWVYRRLSSIKSLRKHGCIAQRRWPNQRGPWRSPIVRSKATQLLILPTQALVAVARHGPVPS